MKFYCDCRAHILKIEDESVGKTKGIWIGIYDICSPKTGIKYKEPRLTGDVVIMNNAYPKELTKLLKFLLKKYMTNTI